MCATATNPPPLFSLITVTLNARAGLQKTQCSIAAQTSKNYEWIVIDGASSDGTQEWLESMSARFISEPDYGLYDAMNKGIEKARGHYLLFLNAGDELAAPDTLQAITDFIGARKPGFVYGDAQEGPHLKHARNHSHINKGMITHHQAMLYDRAALQNLRYDTGYKIAADYDFTARFLLTKPEALYCPFPICIFESGGLSQQQAKAARQEEAAIRRTLGLTSTLSRALIYMRQSAAHILKTRIPALYRIMR
ncbi:MAG: glycosyltransferase [Alphaproteobacteria bacterium]|nr:glycosyltransferase [Alphaproteobacteria bacterium]